MVEHVTRPRLKRFDDWRTHAPDRTLLWVDVHQQRLWVLEGFDALDVMRCSTAAAGVGEREGSFRTPRGWHAVSARIGDRLPEGAVLESRQWTGRRWMPVEADREAGAGIGGRGDHASATVTEVEPDLVLTRVLWLEGLEPGRNRGGDVDSRSRFIYIHGTNQPAALGTPASHGCVRLACRDVIRLHDLVAVGHPVWIG